MDPNDNASSSVYNTQGDESIDSIDELNLKEKNIQIEHILLPENTIYFKILNLF